MELNEKQFITGFNHGYVLAEYEPQLLTKLLKGLQTTNSYTSGITYGQKEFELEKSNSQLNELSQIRQKGRDELNLDRD